MEFKIRKFLKEDIWSIIEIDEMFPPRSRKLITWEEALKLYEKNRNACLIAEKDGRIVGAILGEVLDKAYIIKFLIIHPEYLGEGLASLLIEEAIKATDSEIATKY
ncbi:MAG: GNAT family N-acetyltransferase [Candidatus Aenigmarchaeota archaeon]|nr:GNAT family N-acetyltransferase [Candidatus Aenigmarchaeota archaeon]